MPSPSPPETVDEAVGTGAGLCLLSRLPELERLADFAVGLGTRGGLEPRGIGHLRLAAEELATNIVVHGYGENAPGSFQVTGGVCADGVWLHLADSGPPFDPFHDAPEPDLETPMEGRRPGGLGLYLVHSVVDEFRYWREDGKNHQVIQVNRPTDPTEET